MGKDLFSLPELQSLSFNSTLHRTAKVPVLNRRSIHLDHGNEREFKLILNFNLHHWPNIGGD